MRRIVGPPPADPNQRNAIYRMTPFVNGQGVPAITLDLLTAVEITKTKATPAEVMKVDFAVDRPKIRIADSYSCQGPIDQVTDLPSERCGSEASTSFFFPHQDGVVFVFACAQHAMDLGRWTSRRFGGCWGGEVEKVPHLMEESAKTFPRIDTPHGEEFRKLVPVPGAPEVRMPSTS
jgi:hypothetical protein